MSTARKALLTSRDMAHLTLPLPTRLAAVPTQNKTELAQKRNEVSLLGLALLSAEPAVSFLFLKTE